MQETPHRQRNWWKIIFLATAAFFVLGIGGCALIGLAVIGTSGGSGGVGDSSESSDGSKQNTSGRSPGTTEIRLGGTEGLNVSCSIEDASGGRSVDTRVPDAIPVEAGWADIVVAVCQKTGTEGTLKAAILIDGEVVSSQETDAQYGTVSISHP